ncbi:MAG: transglutaminase domain-containing protein, partial [Acidobacteriaceae bacterium]
VEYQYELQYDDNYVEPPRWFVQQDVYVHKAHYHFVPLDLSGNRFVTVTDPMGKERTATRLLYYQNLPGDAKVKDQMDGFDLTVENISPLPDEEYSPPMESFSYRVIFYYSPEFTGADFWKDEGKTWSKDVDRFAEPSDAIRQAVAQITAPGDNDEQKLTKIYAAVMGLENTSFTREHSAAENRAEGLHVKTAADIWAQKRGTDDEITRLFIAMARAAGMRADAMIVADRDENFLNTGYLKWDQLEDEIAIVTVGGKEMYFDPGERYCEFGELHWRHTQVQGMRQTDKGPVLAVTPGSRYADNRVVRIAELQLGADGSLKGVIRIAMTGVEALRWRQRALVTDEATIKKEFEDELQERVPDGVVVKTNHFLSLTDYNSQFMAVMDVSGSMGTVTGKRVFVPGAFFEARVKPLFAETKRENPVDLHYPYVARDEGSLTVAPGLTMESVPTNGKVPLKTLAFFQEVYGAKGSEYQQVREMALGTPLYKAEEYADLRDFFQKANAQDEELLVLKREPVATTTAAAGSAAQ